MTIPQLLDRTCERHGGRDAVIFDEQGVRLSWHDLRQRADEVAAVRAAGAAAVHTCEFDADDIDSHGPLVDRLAEDFGVWCSVPGSPGADGGASR
jgi:hypothetical protein